MSTVLLQNGTSIHYESGGEGYPLVFIHGWSQCGSVWKFQLEHFSSRYRVIVMDLRGHGGSSSPESGYGINALASDIEELFESLDLHKAVLVGWSMGALISLAAYPALLQRLSSLVLVSGTSKFTTAEGYACGLAPREVKGLSLRLRRNPTATLEGFSDHMFTSDELEELSAVRSAEMTRLERIFPEQGVALQTLETLVSADLRHLLPGIGLPVLLVHGDRDSICPSDASRFMASCISGATLSIIAGAGHAPFMTRPVEFNEIVANFLERVYESD